MYVTSHITQLDDTSTTIDVTIHYAPDGKIADERKLFRCHLDRITGRFTVFHEGIVRSTLTGFVDIENQDEQEERAILAAIHFPSTN